MSVRVHSGTRAALSALFLTALMGCSSLVGGPDISVTQTGAGVGQAVPAGTEPEDVVIGRREHPRIVATYGGVYSDKSAEIMLARITGRLLAAADQDDVPFTVTILDTPDVNAFALPGGYVYVTRGILALSNDESELAAVLAHEIAHVTLKHARARSNRVRTSQIVDRVITGVLGGDLDTDQTAARSRLSLAAFSQAQELAADKEGVVISSRAGYDPQAAARFLAAMGRFAALASSQADGGTGDDFLSSHPSTPDRIQKALDSAQPFGEMTGFVTGRKDYLTAIEGLAFGDSPSQGAVVGRQFIHPALGFTFTVPASYALQNTLSAVVGVAGDGEAVRFDSAQVPKDMPLADYLKSGWITGLKPETITTEERDGVAFASGVAQTDQWHFQVTAVRIGDEVYRFIFASREGDAGFVSRARETVLSFRRASDTDLSRIRRTVIDLVTARAGDTTASLARKMQGGRNAEELFLVLNNLYPGDPVEPGETYKIVVVE